MKSRFVALALVLLPCAVAASPLPRIIAGSDNQVPRCVTPASLMAFVAERNAGKLPPRTIDPRFSTVAALYERIGACVARPPGQCVAVRWDYAFFQMLIETNYLTFRRPDGVLASVTAQDNNFAGVGAAVSGKPGERFKDVSTGVLAHLQHVLMYSATHIANPVANRTRQVQDDVQAEMRRLGRPVTFTDLARGWSGGSPGYAAQMQKMADNYAAEYCRGDMHSERISLK